MGGGLDTRGNTVAEGLLARGLFLSVFCNLKMITRNRFTSDFLQE